MPVHMIVRYSGWVVPVVASIAALAAIVVAPSAIAENLIYCRQAKALEGQGRLEEQIVLYTRCIKTGDLSPQVRTSAYYNRGNAYSDRGQNDRAIQDYDAAIGINPNDADVYNNRGIAYRNKGLYDRAIQDYDKAIEIDPKKARVYTNRGNAYSDKGQYDRAIQDYDKAIEIDPKSARASAARGNVYRSKGLYDRAIQDYDKAIELDPQYALAYENRGLAYYSKGQYQRAAAEFRAALTLKPDNAYPALLLYLVNEQLGGGARSELMENAKHLYLDKWPGALVRFNLGQIPEDEALTAAKNADATKQREQECEAFYYVGMAHLLRGDSQGAVAWFRKAMDTGVKHFTEYGQSRVELERLGAPK